MSNPDRIEVGDIVNVQFEHLTTIFRAEVLYGPPVAVGDSWVLRGESEENLIFYVQQFSQMVLLKKKKK